MTRALVAFDDLPWDWMERHCPSNAYRSATFLKAWLRHRLGKGAPWAFSFAGRDGDPGFVAPLGIWHERHLWTTVRMLRPIGWDVVWPSVCVPFSLDHLESLAHMLSQRRSDWDVLEFAHVTDEPAALSSMVHALTSAGLDVGTVVEPGYPYVNLSGSWDSFYREKSANFRKNIRWLLNQSTRLGVQYRRADGHAAYEALEPIFELHVRRWSQYGLPSVYAADTYRTFIQALCDDFADSRAVAVHSLRLNERALAVAVCFECGDTIYFHHTAFDEEFAKLSPGKLLLYFVIRDAFDRGFKKFDPGLGRDGYKYWWTNASRTLCWFRVSVNRNARAAMWTEDHVLRPVWRAAKRHWRRLRGYRPRPPGGKRDTVARTSTPPLGRGGASS